MAQLLAGGSRYSTGMAVEESRRARLVSLNVGLPREVTWRGATVGTGIYKDPVAGRIALRTLNLDGDRQADLTVHGGAYKAVYFYPLEHYAYWKGELPGRELPMGAFGENLTTEGLMEDSANLGDCLSVGSAEVYVTQPRLPCYKLGIRFESEQMVKRFFASRRTGFYVGVSREGEVGAGDEIKFVTRDPRGVAVTEITRLYAAKKYTASDVDVLRRLLEIPAVPPGWRDYFRDRMGE
jgi:MOSC domain-containing protein YiiM